MMPLPDVTATLLAFPPSVAQGSAAARGAQVFDDPTGRRRTMLRRWSAMVLLALCALVLVVGWQLVQGHWATLPTAMRAWPAALKWLPTERRPDVLTAWLDTLASTGHRAAFRVAGTDVLAQPELVRRIAADGHVIVAATFSGGPIEEMSVLHAEAEIAATQLALAGLLGQQTPWVDCGDATADAGVVVRLQWRGGACAMVASESSPLATPLSPASAALALAVALRWTETDAPSRAPGLLQASVVDRGVGVVLLALLGAVDAVLRVVTVFTLLLFCLFVVRFCWIARAMLCRAARQRQGVKLPDDARLPPISVIVPAYNEEKVIVATVRSVLACAYPSPVQVIVVDDGSRDGTLPATRAAFDDHPHVTVITQPNGGKSTALNRGLQATTTPIVVCIDADTQLDPQALRLLSRHFDDPEVGAVAGNPKVGNRRNLLTRVQALEYVVVDSVERQALEGCNAITCITGALGAYRSDLLHRLGGHVADTLAEDTDMTLRILRSGARIVYEEDAVAWTEAPETLRDFMRQRFRWMFGTVQAAFKYRASLFAARQGGFGWVALPNLLLVQVGAGCLLLPLVDLVALLALAWLVVGGWIGWLFPQFGMLLRWFDRHEVWFYALFGTMSLAAFVMAGIALRLDRRERLRSLLWLLPMQLVLRVLLGLTAYRCIGRAWSGRSLGWGTLARTGHVERATPQGTLEAAP